MNTEIWENRSSEEAILFNPAFLSTIIYFSAKSHKQQTGKGIHYALIYLVPGLILVNSIRETLPKNSKKSIAAWTHENPESRFLFPTYSATLSPLVKESIIFGTNHSLIAVNGINIEPGKLRRGALKNVKESASEEFKLICAKAEFVGKWFAKSGSPETIMAMLGVKP